MNVVLVGNFSSDDEGMAKTAHRYAEQLSTKYAVSQIDLTDSSPVQQLAQIRAVDPDVIHYIPGPSRASFLFTKVASWLVSDAIVVHSAMHPKANIGPRFIYRHVDLLVHQSNALAEQFGNTNARTLPLSSGVDIERFNPVSEDEKLDLRQQYDIPIDDDVVLHVGHINEGRSVNTLVELLDERTSVLLIGSERNSDPELVEQLRATGCRVMTEYQTNIEELYQLSDVYAFTVPPENELSSINVPLSVLEALATGLPVATTRYGALEQFFSNYPAVRISENPADLNTAIRTLLDDKLAVTTARSTVEDSSWDRIGTKLKEAYLSTYEEKHGQL